MDHYKILIVDDSDVIREEMAHAFQSGPYVVMQARNGEEGFRLAQAEGDFAAIITDLNMPDMDGLMMIKSIRALDLCLDTPIFMLTTETSIELKKRGREVGVFMWIVKPAPAEKVVLSVGKVLEQQNLKKAQL